MTRHLTEHPNQRRQESMHRPDPRAKGKEKQKEIRFNESLEKNPSRGLNTPVLTYWHNWPISQLILLCTSYSDSPRRRERHLEILLLIHNHFSCKYLSLQKKLELHTPDVIWYNSKRLASPSPLKICSSKTTDMIGPCTIQDTLGVHISREYKLGYWPIVPIYQSGRDVESSGRILLQRFIKENLLLLFFVLWRWGLDKCSDS